ncbi:hypothetical protein DFU00_004814 [Salmonella enterica subsp. enterica serovar Wandsworth]|nr:hypothetical protein [Salmonella enterica subsp. enterica serovar Wandsworth]EDS5038005.1 hypothetical protein [Salmonella enterica subsp. enterica serovar Wandsworth]EGZ4493949.1 hypothetical protein [Salmonella enterica subsp. enterica serovar Wandsworth]
MARYDIPDEAWTLIQPLLPAEPAVLTASGVSLTIFTSSAHACFNPFQEYVFFHSALSHHCRLTHTCGGNKYYLLNL